MVQPLLIVEAPAIQPYRYGLESVAQPAPTPDLHWLNGVQYEQLGTYEPGVWPGSCAVGATGNLSLPSTASPSIGLPFSAYAGVTCAVVGYSEDYIRARAYAILKMGWQHAAEQALWSGTGSTAPALTSATTIAATGVSMIAGVAALEDYLANNYLGVGVIHAPRKASARAAYARQVEDRGNELQTIIGTRWCFGGGYPNTGPGGVAAGTNIAWMYATGLITVRRDEPFINGGLAQSFDRSTNQQTVFAEQPSVLTVDGPIVAVSVDLTL